ncbi:MAG: hypothetical protein LBD12_04435, partial [Clostridiales Family XIII bacterium]|nr:hypothetical protein [Clostridiales Family XIII bacterium]
MPDFLKKFRNRLLLLNMASLILVMALSFSVIFFVLSMFLRSADRDRLEAIPADVFTSAMLDEQVSAEGDAGAGSGPVPGKGRGGVLFGNSAAEVAIDFGSAFVVNVDRSGQITVFSRIELTENDYVRAVRYAT